MKIHPDGSIEIASGHQGMIGPDGKVKEIPYHDVEAYKEKKWPLVNNPRRLYYPEYDKSRGGIQASNNIIDNLDPIDVLPGGEV